MPRFELNGPAGRLVAYHDPPQAAPPGRGPRGALICHPHPLQGGTLDNKVVMTLAKALRAEGLHVLRFNFRGAGGSEGVHDEGRGEQQDVAVALDELERLVSADAPLQPGQLLAAGFSFGSYVGLEVGRTDPRVGALLAVAPPVNYYDYCAIGESGKPLCVIYAREDELVPVEEVEAWLRRCARMPRLVPVVGASHLFHAKLRPVGDGARGFLAALQQGDEPPG